MTMGGGGGALRQQTRARRRVNGRRTAEGAGSRANARWGYGDTRGSANGTSVVDAGLLFGGRELARKGEAFSRGGASPSKGGREARVLEI